MKELQAILRSRKQTSNNRPRSVLATVVDVKGSSYRLPGAKMLIGEASETIGTVSGGCLEADVTMRAAQVLQTNRAQIFVYDTTANDDSVFSLNMGCRGVVRILLEPVRDNLYLDFVEECFTNRQRGAVATLINLDGLLLSADAFAIGERLFASIKDASESRFDRAEFAQQLFLDVFAALEKDASTTKIYQTQDGAAEFFIEVVAPPVDLIIFGAGHDAVPLVEAAKILGWRVTVVDPRPAYANAVRFQQADEIIVTSADDLIAKVTFSRNSVAVVMTHNFTRDKEIIKRLLAAEVKYIGALGPKSRTETILQELTAEGATFTTENLQKLHAPIGLDIGATTPEAIALSIIAEIQTVLANRKGGFLRDRHGSIYNR